MRIKDFKKEIRNTQFEIPDIKDKIKESNEFKNREYYPQTFKIFMQKNWFKMSFASIVLALIVVFLVIYVKNKNAVISYEATAINYVTDQSDLNNIINYVDSETKSSIFDIVKGWFIKNSTSDGMHIDQKVEKQLIMIDDIAIVQSRNDQEEYPSDIMQVKDNLVYTFNNDTIVVNSIHDGTIEENKVVELSNGKTNFKNSKIFDEQLFITSKYLIAAFLSYRTDQDIFLQNQWNYTLTINVIDLQTLEIVKAYSTKCSQIDKICIVEDEGKETLNLVFNRNLEKADNGDYLLPKEYIDGVEHQYTFNEIAYYNCINNFGYTYIVTIKLDETLDLNSKVQLSSFVWNDVYVDNDSIYLASVMSKEVYQAYVRYDYKFSGMVTVFIKYSIQDGKIIPATCFYAEGKLPNTGIMKEENGLFKVLLNNGSTKLVLYDVENNQVSLASELNLGISDKDVIKEVFYEEDEISIESFKSSGKTEIIRIDIENIYNPEITSTQTIKTEYSDYLQYLQGEYEGLAIGIGYSIDYENYGNIKEVKIVLYNVKEEPIKQIDIIAFKNAILETNIKSTSLFYQDGMIGIAIGGTYYLYDIVLNDEEYTLEEIKSLSISSSENVNNSISRMIYQDGYYYLLTIDNTKNQKINTTILDSNLNIINK